MSQYSASKPYGVGLPLSPEEVVELKMIVQDEDAAAALDFLRWAQRGAITFDLPDAGSLAEVLAISERFNDLPFDLADASVAEAAARFKIRHVLTLDADFDVYRDKAGKALVNLLRHAQ